jgi:hypothetical protein
MIRFYHDRIYTYRSIGGFSNNSTSRCASSSSCTVLIDTAVPDQSYQIRVAQAVRGSGQWRGCWHHTFCYWPLRDVEEPWRGLLPFPSTVLEPLDSGLGAVLPLGGKSSEGQRRRAEDT